MFLWASCLEWIHLYKKTLGQAPYGPNPSPGRPMSHGVPSAFSINRRSDRWAGYWRAITGPVGSDYSQLYWSLSLLAPIEADSPLTLWRSAALGLGIFPLFQNFALKQSERVLTLNRSYCLKTTQVPTDLNVSENVHFGLFNLRYTPGQTFSALQECPT